MLLKRRLKNFSKRIDLTLSIRYPYGVSPVHCVPKKGGITVVVNEENELIPTRLVTGWRVCIDYRKLNEATRKDALPSKTFYGPRMLERLAGNEIQLFPHGFLYLFFLLLLPPVISKSPLTPLDQKKDYFHLPIDTESIAITVDALRLLHCLQETRFKRWLNLNLLSFLASLPGSFDQIEPLQFPVIHEPPQEMSIQDMEDLKQQHLDEIKTLINEKDYRNGRIDIEIKINELKGNFNEMSIEINKKKKLQTLEQEYTIAITPEEPVDSLIMEDEHLDTIPETESDEFIKSSVEN
ncbi:hypothetical protein Tco_1132741 [Tanacetum coccineum]|uniref:Uncharacterized protein n=1 Tax=Tanacetum coccineum TaxID=301880 RepID=A0ABQ5JE65_9ASTR